MSQIFNWLFWNTNTFSPQPITLFFILWLTVIIKHIICPKCSDLADWNRFCSTICLHLVDPVLPMMTTSFPVPPTKHQNASTMLDHRNDVTWMFNLSNILVTFILLPFLSSWSLIPCLHNNTTDLIWHFIFETSQNQIFVVQAYNWFKLTQM